VTGCCRWGERLVVGSGKVGDALGVAVEKSAERLGGDPLLGQSVVSDLWECDMWHQPFPSRRSLSVAVVGLAVLAGGCGVDPVGTEPLPTPMPSCTPDGSSAPCTWERAAEQAEAAAAFAEAEHAYREFTKERNVVMQDGGSKTPTSTMVRYADGDYLKTIQGFSEAGLEEGLHSEGDLEVRDVRPLEYSTNRVTMRACEDGTRVSVVSSSGEVIRQGTRGAVELKLERRDGVWVIIAAASVSDPSCE